MLLPAWAESMREVFKAGTVSQFLLHGNVRDLIREGPDSYLSLREFLAKVMFARFDLVVYYNAGSGLRVLKGQDEFSEYLKLLSNWTNFNAGQLPRETGQVLDLLDGLLRYSLQRTVAERGQARPRPLKTAVILDYAQFLVPSHTQSQSVSTLVKLLDWSSNTAYIDGHLATLLIADSLKSVARDLVENPFTSKIEMQLPNEFECHAYLESLAVEFPKLEKHSELPIPTLAKRAVGLTLVNLRHMVALAINNGQFLDSDYLSRCRKELIEKECYGLLEFVESRRSLDDVAGHAAAKEWLRADAQLIRQGESDCLPMGYLVAGRIGTGKTWLTNCWAGEVGVPFVIFKNFRDRWAGATESNLEKIFAVLKALGQVVVFVDEADQMAGKRGGSNTDGGLSGRIYAMLAKAMSDTDNRGKIFWVFATSRPDLLEVDLKRPGRLDIHIPLFPPQDDEERQQLFVALARKVGMDPTGLPALPSGLQMSGNEMEALLVRAVRQRALKGGEMTETLSKLVEEFRPMAHKAHLEFMDLVAVKECTDESFLPQAYRGLTPAEVDSRIDALKMRLHL
jgi:AAA+ superfamily predicted ATPase